MSSPLPSRVGAAVALEDQLAASLGLPVLPVEVEEAKYLRGGVEPMVRLHVIAQYRGERVPGADIFVRGIDPEFPQFDGSWFSGSGQRGKSHDVPLGCLIGVCAFSEEHGVTEAIARIEAPAHVRSGPIYARVVIELGAPRPAARLAVQVRAANRAHERGWPYAGPWRTVELASPRLGIPFARYAPEPRKSTSHATLSAGEYRIAAGAIGHRLCSYLTRASSLVRLTGGEETKATLLVGARRDP